MLGWWMAWIGMTGASVALLVGLLLPQTRIGAHEALLPAPPEQVRRTILDAGAQPAWRQDVTSVDLAAGGRAWTERIRSGERIRFELIEASDAHIALRFRNSRGDHGHWVGDIAPTPTGETRLRVQESAVVPDPLARIAARVFFDPKAFARRWVDALAAEPAGKSTPARGSP
jgi:hypothetical protein